MYLFFGRGDEVVVSTRAKKAISRDIAEEAEMMKQNLENGRRKEAKKSKGRAEGKGREYSA
ncbi:uncharacterized protein ARB_03905 [Trichophyton benhamiae CBS 112371]|uniref:Uncharacterized protein n=1 Tax=Arthroderma benhamiae (strain ATCC MYA-4681 / CBS 112371) TaxID=663331 RepID=D4B5Z8_ARTBC|nr:uncharacterized protein ARB_03905 [Trichophyton benhamiae CBS 112371]EFE29334.1 hypothetical protein ARB_03905 [Trichophyton benhamiae CBS 112371]